MCLHAEADESQRVVEDAIGVPLPLADAGAWFDVPVRPHTDNEFVRVDPPYQTAPHLVGDRASNLANLRQRYELIPYYYSLAHRAHLFGEPVVPPLVLYHQDDPAVRRMGHEKLIGRDLLVAVNDVGTIEEKPAEANDRHGRREGYCNVHAGSNRKTGLDVDRLGARAGSDRHQ